MKLNEIELVDNILKPEDFVRLRNATAFADIPIEHARKALQNGLINVSALIDGELIGDRDIGLYSSYKYSCCIQFGIVSASGGAYYDSKDNPSEIASKSICLYPNGELTYSWRGVEQRWNKSYKIVRQIAN